MIGTQEVKIYMSGFFQTSEKMYHIFPKKTTKIKLWTKEIMVQHANTGRLQNSSKIYVQKLLNSVMVFDHHLLI